MALKMMNIPTSPQGAAPSLILDFLSDLQMNFPAPHKASSSFLGPHLAPLDGHFYKAHTRKHSVWAPLAQPSPRGTNTPTPKLSNCPENIGQTLPTGTTAA